MGKKDNEDKPAPPKKALSAFFLFRQEVYDKVKQQNPDAKITELTKIISEMWGKADKATKDRLQKAYQKNKQAAAKQKEAYEKKWGKIERKKRRKNNKKN